jgi:hypothetical protein
MKNVDLKLNHLILIFNRFMVNPLVLSIIFPIDLHALTIEKRIWVKLGKLF